MLIGTLPRVGDKWSEDVAMPDMEDKEYAITYCKFAPRCPYATEECRQKRPDMVQLNSRRKVFCFHPLVKQE